MKKVLSFIAVFLFCASISTNASTSNNSPVTESCFSIARNWVIQTEGEINIDNVGFVLQLTEYLNSKGICR